MMDSRRIFHPILALFIIAFASCGQNSQVNLNEDAKKLTNILKKSVQSDVDMVELEKESALFSTRISKYSDSDRLYLSKVGLLLNELVLATWDDYVENLEKFDTTEYTPSARNEKIQNIIIKLGKYGLKLEMDEEIPGARKMLFEMKRSLPETKFKEMLKQLRTWIKSDLDSTYDSIFAKDCKLDADTRLHGTWNHMWIGIILVLMSAISLRGFFLKNEWRAPLLELSHELGTNPASKKMQVGIRRRGTMLVFFFVFLFTVGSFKILESTVIENFKAIVFLVLGIIALWLLKGAYELIRAFNSRKTWFLNYLFSPYIFAWRRDHLSQYSDYEISCAILKLCNLKPKTPLSENIDLRSFMIALHKHVRPKREHDSYPSILDENIRQAEQMTYI